MLVFIKCGLPTLNLACYLPILCHKVGRDLRYTFYILKLKMCIYKTQEHLYLTIVHHKRYLVCCFRHENDMITMLSSKSLLSTIPAKVSGLTEYI